MTLEDIDYLKKNEYKQSYMFYVDSKFRDKNTYHTPAEYSIHFSTPFKNVFAIEVLDASIPRTQYSIDTHNNKLVILYNTTDEIIFNIEPSDYTDVQLIETLNEMFTLQNISLQLANVSDPGDKKVTFRFISSVPFILDMKSSTINTELGFDEYAKASDSNLYAIDSLGKQFFRSISNVEIDPIKYNAFSTQNVSNTLNNYSDPKSNYSYTLQENHNIYQKFTIDEESDGIYGYISKFTLYCENNTQLLNVNISVVKQITTSDSINFQLLHIGDSHNFEIKPYQNIVTWEAPIDSEPNDKNTNIDILTPGDYYIFIHGVSSPNDNSKQSILLSTIADVEESDKFTVFKEDEEFIDIKNYLTELNINETNLYYYVSVGEKTDKHNIPNIDGGSGDLTDSANNNRITYRITGLGYKEDEYGQNEAPVLTLQKGKIYNFNYDTAKYGNVGNQVEYPLGIYPTVINPEGTYTGVFGGDQKITSSSSFNNLKGEIVNYDDSGLSITYNTDDMVTTIDISEDADDFDLFYMSTTTQDKVGNLIKIRDRNESIVTKDINNEVIQPMSLAFTIETIEKPHTVTAPGIYSLIGDRYVILKCPEIEQHLYRSRSYEQYTMGLAKFKLSNYGYDETRLDFTKMPLREFHPIGKLSNMHFRFERPDGELYNFKGINHTITFSIHYYEPIQTKEFTEYSLNPQYDPDIFRSIQNNESSDDESDSD